MAYQVTAGRFVGRTHELARLHELLARALDGEPQAVLIGGEAGIGKTRLTEHLSVTARDQGMRVLRGGCVPLGEDGVPFAPVIQALRGLAELDPAERTAVAGPACAELKRLLPDVPWDDRTPAQAGIAANLAGGAGGIVVNQGQLFAMLLGVVERLAATAPLLWVIEDLQWADRSTRDLVAFLSTALRSGRVLLVYTFRTDEVDRLHPLRALTAELARNRRVSRLDLPRFTRGELAEQLADLMDAEPPTRLVEDIYARTEGNPFFAEELLLAGDGGGPAGLPPNLQEVLLTRVIRLRARTQQLLQAVAAAGPGATQPLLAAAAGMDEAEVLEGLHEAVDQQLLRPEPDGPGYVFRHALVAEAVYSELLPGERVRLHAALAGALEADLETGGPPATRAARLAHHWSVAGDHPRALTASVQAAATAERVYAFAEAQLQLERVLALWDRVPDAEARVDADRVGVLWRGANAAHLAGDLSRAAELARRAVESVDGVRQPRRAGLLHELLARCLRRLGDPAALGEHQEAVRLMPPELSAERAQVLNSLARHLLVIAARPADARVLAAEAVTVAQEVGAVDEEATARATLGAALVDTGAADDGLAELEAARRLAARTADELLLLPVVVDHSDALMSTGRMEQAATVALDGLDHARRLGLAHYYQPILACNATQALIALGRWDEAERVSREALAMAPPDPTSAGLLIVRAALEIGRGELDRAQARLLAAQHLVPTSNPDAQRAGPMFCGLAEVALWRGDVERAKRLVAEAVPKVQANPRFAAPLYALGVRVEADRAELARARRPGQSAPDDGTAAALLQQLDQVARAAGAALPDRATWHTTARAELTRHGGTPDPSSWAEAAAAWERLGQPYRIAYARFRQAEAALATGDRDIVAATLRSAAAITDRLAARPLDAELRALARRARIDLASAAEAPAAGPSTVAQQLGLTTREVEVLALVAAGRSNRQIGQALFISPKTASVHVSNLLAKLGVHTRVEAAAIAHRLGLTDPTTIATAYARECIRQNARHR